MCFEIRLAQVRCGCELECDEELSCVEGVSIIVPVFPGTSERSLKQSFASLRQQSCSDQLDVRVVVTSKDEPTLQRIASEQAYYRDFASYEVVSTETSREFSEMIKRELVNCDGEFLAIADVDAPWHPRFIERSCQELKLATDFAAVLPSTSVNFESKTELGTHNRVWSKPERFLQDADVSLLDYMVFSPALSVSPLLRRSKLLEIGLSEVSLETSIGLWQLVLYVMAVNPVMSPLEQWATQFLTWDSSTRVVVRSTKPECVTQAESDGVIELEPGETLKAMNDWKKATNEFLRHGLRSNIFTLNYLVAAQNSLVHESDRLADSVNSLGDDHREIRSILDSRLSEFSLAGRGIRFAKDFPGKALFHGKRVLSDIYRKRPF